MNEKEISEIRRRFRTDRSNITYYNFKKDAVRDTGEKSAGYYVYHPAGGVGTRT